MQGVVAFVHPTQIDIGDPGNGFVAVGTYRGRGVGNCPDDYTNGWDVYTDGQIGGVYFRHREAVNAYSAGDTPFFKIFWGTCPLSGNTAWVMRFGGTIYECQTSNQQRGSYVNALLETCCVDPAVDRNIDVQYTGLQTSIDGHGSYVDMGGASLITDPSYTATQPNDTSVNAYLAPLD